MKIRFTHYALLSMLLLAVSCESDELNYAQSVPGTWFQDAGAIEGTNLSFRNEILFRNDGTYEEAYMVIETNAPNQIVGYLSLFVGEYEIEDNILKRFNIEQYGLDNENEYLDREELVLEGSDQQFPEVELKLNKAADQLTFDFCPGGPCPAIRSSVEFQTFYRSR